MLNVLLLIFTKEKFSCQIWQQKLFRQKKSQRTYKIHDKSKAFKYDVCLQKFMSEGHLFQHYQTHTVEKLFSC